MHPDFSLPSPSIDHPPQSGTSTASPAAAHPSATTPTSTSPAKSPPTSPSRPPLVRNAAREGNESPISPSAVASPPPLESATPASDARTMEKERTETVVEEPAQARILPSGDELKRLRDAVNAKFRLEEQRARLRAAGATRTASGLGLRRVSPIKEEPIISPSLEAAFSSPLPSGALTTSTESTESNRTVKGSVVATPNAALRTPSYPFPYVPTPKGLPVLFHQPFTALSPTGAFVPFREHATPRESTLSEVSTPTTSAATFLPVGVSQSISDEEEYPTPNLYELVLLLNSEPGLDNWWQLMVNLLRDWYGAERASLAMPADAADLENVPWGQKATFNQSGPEKLGHFARDVTKSSSHSPENTLIARRNLENIPSTPNTGPGRPRPKLESRHSYAGYESDRSDVKEMPVGRARPSRPKGPLRTVSHAPGPPTPMNWPDSTPLSLQAFTQFSLQSSHNTSFSDMDFSSQGGEPPGPFISVFPVLKALQQESDPLVDSAGVNQILHRGKMVTLTRDYAVSASRGNSSAVSWQTSRNPPENEASDDQQDAPQANAKGSSQLTEMRARAGRLAKSGGDYFSQLRKTTKYEEYEQIPASPWQQSPAPSPAIQKDPEQNPFFAESNVEEDSFNPTNSTQDYSQFVQVEAIGVDSASTIIHLPLYHPVHSGARHVGPSGAHVKFETQFEDDKHGLSSDSNQAPIAILSVLASAVPYPQHLAQSLKLLGPHIATSCYNAQLYSLAVKQASSRNRLSVGPRVGFAASTSGVESLDDVLRINMDDLNESAPGSITSPSDYSGRSRHSPGGSLGGTPGWELSEHGYSSRRSVTGTPAPRPENIDSYFDAKKQTTMSRSSSHTSLQQATSTANTGRESPSGEARPSSRRAAKISSAPSEDDVNPRSEPRAKRLSMGREDATLATFQDDKVRQVQVKSPQRQNFKAGAPQQMEHGERRQHSQLHSYGASFATNFPSLPVATTPIPRGSGYSHLVHGTSSSDFGETMPAPSERLLRTITDALPVQIFIAEPNTGALAWVNSKFLVYRGQEPGQILKDPWGSIHPDDHLAYMESWERCLKTGQQFSHKVRLKRFDGHFRWFFVRATPLRNPRHNIVHWAGTNMDFHEQHLAEMNAAHQQETAASEAKYRALANSSPQVVFAVNKSKGVTFCNSQWLYYSGQTEAEAKGVGFMDYVHPDDLSKCRLPDFGDDGSLPTNVPTTLPADPRRTLSSQGSSDASSETVTSPGSDEHSRLPLPQKKLSELATTGILKVSVDAEGRPSYSTEVRLKSKDGQYRWHLVRILLAQKMAIDEEQDTWYGTCTDINDHKLLEQTLKETMDAKSRFLSNMSHEIRTPLNGITGMVNLLIDSNLTAEAMEHVNVIRNCTEGLRSLINDILDLSKVEAGMIKLNMDWLDVRSLIEEIQDVTGTMAIDKGLELNYLVEADVPTRLKGDRFRIRQVLLNVVGNAIKFTDHGEVFVRCQAYKESKTTQLEGETYLLFEVIDTGRGFTEKEAEFLFKRFSQIDGSSTRQHGGTGLGLAISMQLVELHGGQMKASSVPGKGSNFTFTLKFGLPTPTHHPRLESAPEPVTALATPDTPATAPDVLSAVGSLPSRGRAAPSSSVVLGQEMSESPAPIGELPHPSPQESSASSDPSIRSSIYSTRSSQSSVFTDHVPMSKFQSMSLQLPTADSLLRAKSDDALAASGDSENTVRPSYSQQVTPIALPVIAPFHPPMYHILVVCPLEHARVATIQHIEMTLPKTIPHQITAPDSVDKCVQVLSQQDPLIFTHVVLVLRSTAEVEHFMTLILHSEKHSGTKIVFISDLAQKRDLEKHATNFDLAGLSRDGRLRIIWKPLKPSKIGVVFDPQKQREMSTDKGSETVQQVAKTQKQLFAETKARLGNRGFKVLLVEDNETNVKVIIRFLERVDIHCDVVGDGVQCTESVFAKEHGYYSVILCDLHMPNKDGYQTCKEIREWEKGADFSGTPIVALSANVLDDVWSRCVEAGFNSYMSKPVDFKGLSAILTKYLDPDDPGKPHKLMKARKD